MNRSIGRLRRRRPARPVLRRRRRSRRALPQREPGRRSAAVRPRSTTRDRPHRASPAPTRSTSTATAVADLAVLRHGENVLLRGLGDCRFERANETWGFDGGDAWTTAFSATWEELARLPTLAFGNYLDLAHEQRTDCADNELVRPSAGGTAFAAPIPLTPGYCTLSMLFSDWDRSGRRDLRDLQRPPLLPRRRGAAVAHRAGPGPAPVHAPRMAGSGCRSGAWASPARTSPATAIPRSS